MLDLDYMKLAIELAKSAEGQTSPNPIVGAVVVKDGQIAGFGAHLKAGEPHAEVHALRMAGDKSEGSTVYVTLEPCSHHGKTPPCADLLIRSKVAKVFVASMDSNPLVQGRGIEKLKAAGIEVETGLLKEEAEKLNEVFFHYIAHKTPFVTLKSAVSLDGKIATSTGESKWITGDEARQDVHVSRSRHDAILVGVNTVIRDNPKLTTRLPGGGGKNPIRIVLDHSLRTPPDCHLATDGEADTWIVTGNGVTGDKLESFKDKRVTLIQLPEEKITIKTLLKTLGERGITSLYVEGGAEVNASFIEAKAVNRMITYIAPKVIGGRTSPASIGGEGFSKMSEVLELSIQSVEHLGKDIRIISEPKKQGEN